ncbi:MAG TPA: Rieske (2Fe-2S) protein [Actinocrinis sp.]|nr:Rieske (2Fe-2S) protein [Actinocrinis sp.]
MALETTEQQTAELTDEQTCCGSSHCGSSRRTLLRAAGVGGAAAAIGLTAAACGSSSSGASAGGSNNNAAAGGSDAGSGGSVLATTSDIPVDGGKIVNADGGIVITQPAAGTYKAFTAICTHSGCTVGSVSDNQITCPCHGSVFSAKDGSVISGPAPAPLAAKNIKVSGTQITLA